MADHFPHTQLARPARRGHTSATPSAVLLLGAALLLTACGEERAGDDARSAPAASIDDARGAPAPAASASISPSKAPSATASSPAPGASPYVEPGVVDGAPHHGENNAYRRAGEMSAVSEKDARKEADRIRPVLKRLSAEKKWNPEAVRAALLRLGYEEERTGSGGERLGGTLTVREQDTVYENSRYVTPEGSLIGLRVHDDACVSAFIDKTDHGVSVTGPYPETGCFQPPYGH